MSRSCHIRKEPAVGIHAQFYQPDLRWSRRPQEHDLAGDPAPLSQENASERSERSAPDCWTLVGKDAEGWRRRGLRTGRPTRRATHRARASLGVRRCRHARPGAIRGRSGARCSLTRPCQVTREAVFTSLSCSGHKFGPCSTGKQGVPYLLRHPSREASGVDLRSLPGLNGRSLVSTVVGPPRRHG